MDKFLEITFENQILATKDGDKFVEYFAPFMEKLKGIVSAELYKKYGFFHFYEWAMNSGYNDSLSIDRIDVNGNYCPENCRWVDMGTQIKNRRNSKNYNWKGEKMNLSDIAKMNNVKYGRLYTRLIDKGMSVEEALRDIGISTD